MCSTQSAIKFGLPQIYLTSATSLAMCRGLIFLFSVTLFRNKSADAPLRLLIPAGPVRELASYLPLTPPPPQLK